MEATYLKPPEQEKNRYVSICVLPSFRSEDLFMPAAFDLPLRGSTTRPSKTRYSEKIVHFSSHEESLLNSPMRTNDSHAGFNLFPKLPPESSWLRSGLVERQTSIADAVWQPRLIVLTSSDVVFAKLDSDAVVDRLLLRSITFVGQVRASAQRFRYLPILISLLRR